MEKKESLLFQVTITGLGGQGALLFGQLLAEAGATRFKNVSFFPQYATVMRGGESECTVTLSEEEIDSPLVFEPQTAVVMAAPQLKQFEKRVLSGGMLFIDNSVITEKIGRSDIKVFYLPATKAATELGDTRVANLVFLGAYLATTKAVPIEAVEEILDKRFKGRIKEVLLSLNKKALREGAKLVTRKRED
jgi:2-oxoglutarate ferredoxin oxidoreductase subunit gamma